MADASTMKSRTEDLVEKVDGTLLPQLSKLPGFGGYHLIEAGDGVMTSVGFFDTSAQADESTKVVTTWLRDEKLEKTLPNPPRITAGEIVAYKTPALAKA